MDVDSVAQVAEELGVTPRQVRNLVRDGALVAVHRGLIDRQSLQAFAAYRQGSHQRSWAQETAWGAISILSGLSAPWIGPTQRSRLRRALKDCSVQELVRRTRNRAVVRHYGAHDSALRRIAAEVIDAGQAGSGLGLAATSRVDGYVSTEVHDDLVSRYLLTEDYGGQVSLRVTDFDGDVIRQIATTSELLAGLDLATAPDPRERSAGLARLSDALDEFSHA